MLVTGAGGMLCSAIVDRLRPPEFTAEATRRAELDITDSAAIRRVLGRFRPHCLINCAAMSDVDGCERDPQTARKANTEGPRLLAEACQERDVELIHISTDYVFDGTKGSPHGEEDPVNPINHYGESKLLGERAVADACSRHRILRVSMLYGIHRTNFADFVVRCIETGQAVKALTDNAGSPTHCPDIAEQIVALLGRPETGVFHCAGLGGCSRLEFAEAIRELWPAPELKIIPVKQADFPEMLAKRPADSRLKCNRINDMGLIRLRPWRDALTDHLEARRLRPPQPDGP